MGPGVQLGGGCRHVCGEKSILELLHDMLIYLYIHILFVQYIYIYLFLFTHIYIYIIFKFTHINIYTVYTYLKGMFALQEEHFTWQD